MREQFPDSRLFWLVGGDQWDELPTWCRADFLAETLEFIVVRRGPEPVVRPGWTSHFLPQVHEASGTGIRERSADPLPSNRLHPSVHKYILGRRLYDT